MAALRMIGGERRDCSGLSVISSLATARIFAVEGELQGASDV